RYHRRAINQYAEILAKDWTPQSLGFWIGVRVPMKESDRVEHFKKNMFSIYQQVQNGRHKTLFYPAASQDTLRVLLAYDASEITAVDLKDPRLERELERINIRFKLRTYREDNFQVKEFRFWLAGKRRLIRYYVGDATQKNFLNGNSYDVIHVFRPDDSFSYTLTKEVYDAVNDGGFVSYDEEPVTISSEVASDDMPGTAVSLVVHGRFNPDEVHTIYQIQKTPAGLARSEYRKPLKRSTQLALIGGVETLAPFVEDLARYGFVSAGGLIETIIPFGFNAGNSSLLQEDIKLVWEAEGPVFLRKTGRGKWVPITTIPSPGAFMYALGAGYQNDKIQKIMRYRSRENSFSAAKIVEEAEAEVRADNVYTLQTKSVRRLFQQLKKYAVIVDRQFTKSGVDFRGLQGVVNWQNRAITIQNILYLGAMLEAGALRPGGIHPEKYRQAVERLVRILEAPSMPVHSSFWSHEEAQTVVYLKRAQTFTLPNKEKINTNRIVGQHTWKSLRSQLEKDNRVTKVQLEAKQKSPQDRPRVVRPPATEDVLRIIREAEQLNFIPENLETELPMLLGSPEIAEALRQRKRNGKITNLILPATTSDGNPPVIGSEWARALERGTGIALHEWVTHLWANQFSAHPNPDVREEAKQLLQSERERTGAKVRTTSLDPDFVRSLSALKGRKQISVFQGPLAQKVQIPSRQPGLAEPDDAYRISPALVGFVLKMQEILYKHGVAPVLTSDIDGSLKISGSKLLGKLEAQEIADILRAFAPMVLLTGGAADVVQNLTTKVIQGKLKPKEYALMQRLLLQAVAGSMTLVFNPDRAKEQYAYEMMAGVNLQDELTPQQLAKVREIFDELAEKYKDELKKSNHKYSNFKGIDGKGLNAQGFFGDVYDYRIAGITFAALGKEAASEVAKLYGAEPGSKERMKKYRDFLKKRFAQEKIPLDLRMGSEHQIDATLKGWNKGQALRFLSGLTGIVTAAMLFGGDNIVSNEDGTAGNDTPGAQEAALSINLNAILMKILEGRIVITAANKGDDGGMLPYLRLYRLFYEQLVPAAKKDFLKRLMNGVKREKESQKKRSLAWARKQLLNFKKVSSAEITSALHYIENLILKGDDEDAFLAYRALKSLSLMKLTSSAIHDVEKQFRNYARRMGKEEYQEYAKKYQDSPPALSLETNRTAGTAFIPTENIPDLDPEEAPQLQEIGRQALQNTKVGYVILFDDETVDEKALAAQMNHIRRLQQNSKNGLIPVTLVANFKKHIQPDGTVEGAYHHQRLIEVLRKNRFFGLDPQQIEIEFQGMFHTMDAEHRQPYVFRAAGRHFHTPGTLNGFLTPAVHQVYEKWTEQGVDYVIVSDMKAALPSAKQIEVLDQTMVGRLMHEEKEMVTLVTGKRAESSGRAALYYHRTVKRYELIQESTLTEPGNAHLVDFGRSVVSLQAVLGRLSLSSKTKTKVSQSQRQQKVLQLSQKLRRLPYVQRQTIRESKIRSVQIDTFDRPFSLLTKELDTDFLDIRSFTALRSSSEMRRGRQGFLENNQIKQVVEQIRKRNKTRAYANFFIRFLWDSIDALLQWKLSRWILARLKQLRQKPYPDLKWKNSIEGDFSQAEIDTIKRRGDLLASVYSKLGPEAKKVLLIPSFLLVFMGIKPIYIRIPEIGDPDPKILLEELQKNLGMGTGMNLLFQEDNSNRDVFDPEQIISALLTRMDFLEETGVLYPGDNFSGSIDRVVTQIRTIRDMIEQKRRMDELGSSLVSTFFQIAQGNSAMQDIIFGVLLKYPEAAIRAGVGRQNYVPGNYAYQLTPYPRIQLVVEQDDQGRISEGSLEYLARMVDTLDYAYSRIRRESDFSSIAGEIHLPERALKAPPQDIFSRTPLEQLTEREIEKADEGELRKWISLINAHSDDIAIVDQGQNILRRLDEGDRTQAEFGAWVNRTLEGMPSRGPADVYSLRKPLEAARIFVSRYVYTLPSSALREEQHEGVRRILEEVDQWLPEYRDLIKRYHAVEEPDEALVKNIKTLTGKIAAQGRTGRLPYGYRHAVPEALGKTVLIIHGYLAEGPDGGYIRIKNKNSLNKLIFQIEAVRLLLNANMINRIDERIFFDGNEFDLEAIQRAVLVRSELRAQLSVSETDQKMARSVIWFFLRRGVYFSVDMEDVYQEIYLAFANARSQGQVPEEKTLWFEGVKAVSSLVNNQTKYKRLVRRIKLNPKIITPVGDQNFPARLQNLMDRQAWNNKTLGEAVGVDQNTVSNWRNGIQFPRPFQMKKLAKVLKVDTSFLMVGVSREELLGVRIDDFESLEYKKIFGLKIKLLRYEKGLSLRELANKVGVNKAAAIDWENGRFKKLPYPSNMKKLAVLLGTTVSQLLAGMTKDVLLNQKAEDEESPEFRKWFSLKITVLRYERGLTQEELGSKAGLSSSSINLLERGGFPRRNQWYVPNLAAELRTSVSQLVAGEAEESLMQAVQNAPTAKERKRFGLKMKVLRLKKGWSMHQLSRETEIDRRILGWLEKGRPTFGYSFMKRLAKSLGVSISRIVAGMPENDLMNMALVLPGQNVVSMSRESRRMLTLKVRVLWYKKEWKLSDLSDAIGEGRIVHSGMTPGVHSVRRFAKQLNISVSRLLTGMSEAKLMAASANESDPDAAKKWIGLKLQVLRYKKGWSLHRLWQETGISRHALDRFEKGRALPPVSTANLLAQKLGSSSDRIFSGVTLSMASSEMRGTEITPSIIDERAEQLTQIMLAPMTEDSAIFEIENAPIHAFIFSNVKLMEPAFTRFVSGLAGTARQAADFYSAYSDNELNASERKLREDMLRLGILIEDQGKYRGNENHSFLAIVPRKDVSAATEELAHTVFVSYPDYAAKVRELWKSLDAKLRDEFVKFLGEDGVYSGVSESPENSAGYEFLIAEFAGKVRDPQNRFYGSRSRDLSREERFNEVRGRLRELESEIHLGEVISVPRSEMRNLEDEIQNGLSGLNDDQTDVVSAHINMLDKLLIKADGVFLRSHDKLTKRVIEALKNNLNHEYRDIAEASTMTMAYLFNQLNGRFILLDPGFFKGVIEALQKNLNSENEHIFRATTIAFQALFQHLDEEFIRTYPALFETIVKTFKDKLKDTNAETKRASALPLGALFGRMGKQFVLAHADLFEEVLKALKDNLNHENTDTLRANISALEALLPQIGEKFILKREELFEQIIAAVQSNLDHGRSIVDGSARKEAAQALAALFEYLPEDFVQARLEIFKQLIVLAARNLSYASQYVRKANADALTAFADRFPGIFLTEDYLKTLLNIWYDDWDDTWYLVTKEKAQIIELFAAKTGESAMASAAKAIAKALGATNSPVSTTREMAQ
ncbi:MAG: helix-turn-helix domain-containing protein, partial [Candidatus Omnitrophica bacterium]|nr:helix-turn-helix domain-containing protein [Candidatus Omnitrophota bacterium]